MLPVLKLAAFMPPVTPIDPASILLTLSDLADIALAVVIDSAASVNVPVVLMLFAFTLLVFILFAFMLPVVLLSVRLPPSIVMLLLIHMPLAVALLVINALVAVIDPADRLLAHMLLVVLLSIRLPWLRIRSFVICMLPLTVTLPLM